MSKEFSGIDEAALGPILGPYCASLVSIKKESDQELFETFSPFNTLKITDSKKLYTGGKSIIPLESTALTFISLFSGQIPPTLFDLLNELMIDSTALDGLLPIPWYKKIGLFTLPYKCPLKDIARLKNTLNLFMDEKKVELSAIRVDVVPAQSFNSHLDTGLNKSQACQKIISPLIIHAMNRTDRLTVDRQGGRRYYGEWLRAMFPQSPLSIIEEAGHISSYRLGNSTIHFPVKGDDKFFETALASIISKYIRELVMACFNEYWQKKVPEIRKTAGYPQDGRRFIRDLERFNIPYQRDVLIRKK